ncbi:hypothetical protein CEP54_015363 [Fusarium duplospermum]|uniref:Uncharacterized protein n=1 Tax=Fusarium duplospermum TaxID=1325734 RepID=A0A428NPS0_9HYPO|nr:hypothetical protein CEP54_015363 [Fusarium duplospermum]
MARQTRATVKPAINLNKPLDWKIWLSSIKGIAEEWEIWQFVNPESTDVLIEPTPAATPTSASDKAEEEVNVGERYQAQKKAIFQLGLVIDRSIARSYLQDIQQTSGTRNRLVALKRIIKPYMIVEELQACNEYRKILRRASSTRISDTVWISAFEKAYHRLQDSGAALASPVWARMDLMQAIRIRDERYWKFLILDDNKDEWDVMKISRLFKLKSAMEEAWESKSSSEAEDEVFAEKRECCFCGKRHLILDPDAHWKSCYYVVRPRGAKRRRIRLDPGIVESVNRQIDNDAKIKKKIEKYKIISRGSPLRKSIILSTAIPEHILNDISLFTGELCHSKSSSFWMGEEFCTPEGYGEAVFESSGGGTTKATQEDDIPLTTRYGNG